MEITVRNKVPTGKFLLGTLFSTVISKGNQEDPFFYSE
jgi:hypothetical protein